MRIHMNVLECSTTATPAAVPCRLPIKDHNPPSAEEYNEPNTLVHARPEQTIQPQRTPRLHGVVDLSNRDARLPRRPQREGALHMAHVALPALGMLGSDTLRVVVVVVATLCVHMPIRFFVSIAARRRRRNAEREHARYCIALSYISSMFRTLTRFFLVHIHMECVFD